MKNSNQLIYVGHCMQDGMKKTCTLFIISVSAHDFAYRAKFDSMQSLICCLLAHDILRQETV